MVFRRNGAARDAMRGGDSEAHNFQEYTYKKITPCDVCSQVLRGKKTLFICYFVEEYNCKFQE